jgi:hypothetical protein
MTSPRYFNIIDSPRSNRYRRFYQAHRRLVWCQKWRLLGWMR